MQTKTFLVRALVMAFLTLTVMTSRPDITLAAATHPNIVLIVADDLGVNDLVCYGADLHETPHLDQLARNGMKFNRAYAPAPVCSPTRAALMTGKAPARLQITIWSEGSLKEPGNRKLLQARSRHDLPHEEVTLAEVLRESGYMTATVGKWHLGDAAHFAETQGFDVSIAGNHWGAPSTFFYPYRGRRGSEGEYRYVPHLEFGKPNEYLTDRLTDEALRVIDHAGNQPFFLYLPHYAPHTPIEAPEDRIAYFEAKRNPEFHHQNAAYAAMVQSVDNSVGRIVNRLKERGLDKKTIVIFTSDNGGFIGKDHRGAQCTNNAPLRSGKGSLYEGGIRIPLIVSWPDVTSPESETDSPVILTDLFHTLTAALSLPNPAQSYGDGVDLTALLKGQSKTVERSSLYFHYPHYYHIPATTPVSAVIEQDWKLIEFFEDGHHELFNLTEDPYEQNDISSKHQQKVTELSSRLKKWRSDVQAALPTSNSKGQ